MKDYTAEFIAELSEQAVSSVFFIEIEFGNQSDGNDRIDYYCTASAPIEWDGHTWQGVGSILNVEPIQESDDLTAHGLKFVISGLTATSAEGFLTDEYQGRPCTCYFGLLDENGVVNTPEIEFKGRMDAPVRVIGDDGSIGIAIPIESRMVRWGVPSGARFTHEEHIRLHPDDSFYSRLAVLTESVEVAWPDKTYYYI